MSFGERSRIVTCRLRTSPYGGGPDSKEAMMRSLFYTKPGLALMDVPEPEVVGPHGVKIRLAYASLCGSDLHILRGDFDAMIPEALPMGHEASGVVLEVGSDVPEGTIKPGDEVTFYFNRYCGACYYCRAGREQFCTNIQAAFGFMTDVIVLDEQQVFVLPKGSSLVAAALIEPTTVALRGLDLTRMVSGNTVAVSGGGGIGQIVASLALHSGASEVTLIEPVETKRAIATSRGVKHVIDPMTEDVAARSQEITSGRGFDIVIETSGVPAACTTAMNIAGRGATVEFLATYAPTATYPVELGTAFMREITLVTGVFQSPYMFPRAIALFEQLQLEELVTLFTPEQFQEGFDAQQKGVSVKTVFNFN